MLAGPGGERRFAPQFTGQKRAREVEEQRQEHMSDRFANIGGTDQTSILIEQVIDSSTIVGTTATTQNAVFLWFVNVPGALHRYVQLAIGTQIQGSPPVYGNFVGFNWDRECLVPIPELDVSISPTMTEPSKRFFRARPVKGGFSVQTTGTGISSTAISGVVSGASLLNIRQMPDFSTPAITSASVPKKNALGSYPAAAGITATMGADQANGMMPPVPPNVQEISATPSGTSITGTWVADQTVYNGFSSQQVSYAAVNVLAVLGTNPPTDPWEVLSPGLWVSAFGTLLNGASTHLRCIEISPLIGPHLTVEVSPASVTPSLFGLQKWDTRTIFGLLATHMWVSMLYDTGAADYVPKPIFTSEVHNVPMTLTYFQGTPGSALGWASAILEIRPRQPIGYRWIGTLLTVMDSVGTSPESTFALTVSVGGNGDVLSGVNGPVRCLKANAMAENDQMIVRGTIKYQAVPQGSLANFLLAAPDQIYEGPEEELTNRMDYDSSSDRVHRVVKEGAQTVWN